MVHKNERIAKLHNDFKKREDSGMENLKENGFINSFSNPSMILNPFAQHTIPYFN